ncbi:MAG: GIY-YIG nuclease family protein [Candidatus Bathyarchaeota archaeon]|nr:GIY-YIG nuclease family protein [Candidatus Bathyarchaeum sp.]
MSLNVNGIGELSGGVYTLLVFVSKELTLHIGSLGEQKFPSGYYTYTGSALGNGATSLKHRISRHLRKEKRMFWHIDCLLSDEHVSVEAVIAVETNHKMECNVNSYLKSLRNTTVPVDGFGASDCTKNCESHLLYFPKINEIDGVVQKVSDHLKSRVSISSVHVFL